MIEILGRNNLTLAEALEREDDLEAVKRALVREDVIRTIMRDSGETHEIAAEMVDAASSMGQETVLDLTEGEPTTLKNALERFVDELGRRLEGDPGSTFGDVIEGLDRLLEYPWPPDPELARTRQDRDQLKAKLTRIVPDREHIAHIHANAIPDLIRWLGSPSGSFTSAGSEGFRRVTFEAGGNRVWVRTAAYAQQEHLGDDHHTLDARAQVLARQIHGAYVYLAPRFGVEVTLWDDLEQYQRDLAVAVTRDLLGGERMATSYGIRPHLPWTSEQDAQARLLAEQTPRTTREDLERQGLL